MSVSPKLAMYLMSLSYMAWELGFEYSLGSKICKNLQPPLGTLEFHLLGHTL